MPSVAPLDFPEPDEWMTGKRRPTLVEQTEIDRVAKEKAYFREKFLTGLMESTDFRQWLMEILVQWGTFENAFGAGPTGFPDAMATQFQLGMKAAGWRLWTTFDDIAPDKTSLMRREF